jgi:hypothetical protein
VLTKTSKIKHISPDLSTLSTGTVPFKNSPRAASRAMTMSTSLKVQTLTNTFPESVVRFVLMTNKGVTV